MQQFKMDGQLHVQSIEKVSMKLRSVSTSHMSSAAACSTMPSGSGVSKGSLLTHPSSE